MNRLNQTPSVQGPNLHDIVLPVEPGIWPLAVGWWLLIAIGLVGLIISITTILRHLNYWKIKRIALNKLSQCESCDDINQLLKQVAIHYCSRQDIGPMKSEQWTLFLMNNLPQEQQRPLTDIHQALYRQDHGQFLSNYRAIANMWLGQLNKNSLREMNNAVV